jgi:WD40 repeat protein/DNA-binding SARP family transcriptional activator
MQIRVLGHLEASVRDRVLPLGGAKQRAVLAMLVLEANRTVSAERLIEGLWGEQVPASAPKMLQTYVWRLRGVLAADGVAEIVTHGRGYELCIDPELVDVRRLERLVVEAGRNGGGAAHEALALFRGDPLADLADEPFAAPEIRRLQELRLTAAELALNADLAAGRHREVIGEIEALLAENPLRERLHGLRMLALYRCERQAEALDAYRYARRTLVEQVGVEPGPELRRLHEEILRQDASLDVEPVVAELPRELDATTAPPLIGRDGELRRLRARWRRATTGAGVLMTMIGGYGMGKTRIASALAGEAHSEDAAVLYAMGTAAPEVALAAVAQVRDARRPTLLVLDDFDRAPAEVHAAVRELAPALAALPVLVLATGQEAAALARLQPRDSMTLGPLDAEAVRLIAGLYAGGRDDVVPVETLLATSRGVAGRVHEAASEWARREATRRVDATAGLTAAGRSQVRALEAELTGNVVDLQSARERARRVGGDDEADEATVVCPYKGLATFEIDDAQYFFGREQLVAELVARLVGAPLLGVVGASGSGKSSALRAGLLHALAGGVLPGSDTWSRVLIRPGEHPLRELRGRLGGDRRVVLVVDQFEELFTTCQDEQERGEFVAEVVRATRDDRCSVVLGVRADFYGRCAEYPDLSRLLGANTVLVGAMSSEELRRAIERPAQRVGLQVDPELADALLADVEGEPGALPLLSTALLQLWGQRGGRRLQFAAYTRSGGVQGAVARLAEDAYVALDPAQQATARNVLLRLAGEGEGQTIVRRRIALSELELERRPDVAEVVTRLTDSRLLTIDDGAVEVAHEALLREWPRLRGWLEDDAQGRRLHRQISDAAHAWDADARDPGGLYRGARLAGALDWRSTHEERLNATERDFLDAGQAAAERAQRRLRMVLGGVSVLLLAAVIAGLVALDQRGRARSGERIAEAQRLGALALSEPALDRSLLLAREAVATDDNRATRDTMLAALLRSPAALGIMRGDGGRMLAVAVRPDGKGIVAGDNRGHLIAFDAQGRRLGPRYDTGLPIQAIRFSPNGTRLAVATGEEFDGKLLLLDGTSLRPIARHRLPVLDAPLRSMDFSPDSRELVTSWGLWNGNRPGPGLITRWDAITGGRLGRAKRLTREGASLVAFIGDGQRLVTMNEAERETVVRDADTLAVIRSFPGAGLHWVSAISADGRTAVLVPDDGSPSLVDLRSGSSRTLPARHDGPVRGAVFAPDGKTLLTTGDDAKVVIWDVRSATPREVFEGHAGGVVGAGITPDGRSAYTAGLDGTVIAWDLSGERPLGRQFTVARRGKVQTRFAESRSIGDAAISWNVAASPNGDLLAVGTNDGHVNVIDGRTLRIARRIRVNRDWGTNAMFQRDGRTMAVAADWYFGLWDARTGTVLHRTRVTREALWGPRISADGHWVALTGIDHKIRIWDARRFEQVKTREMDLLPRDLSMRPDGKIVVVPVEFGAGTGRVEILAVPSLKRVARIPMRHTRWSSFSRDGRMFIVGDYEGRAQIFDGHTFKPRGRPLVGHSGTITNADFSPDGRRVATASGDGTVRLWDTETGRPIARPLPGLPNVEVGVAFMGDDRLAAVYDTGQAYLWDIRPSSWLRRACALAGRPLTRQEWADVLPEREYNPACRP